MLHYKMEIGNTCFFLNCTSTEILENRPILIIRELINFNPKTLQNCSRAMEKAKEKELYIPVILENSDNLWYEVVATSMTTVLLSISTNTSDKH